MPLAVKYFLRACNLDVSHFIEDFRSVLEAYYGLLIRVFVSKHTILNVMIDVLVCSKLCRNFGILSLASAIYSVLFIRKVTEFLWPFVPVFV